MHLNPRDLPHLETERLVIRPADQDDVAAVVRYYTVNREFLRPFDPARTADFYEEEFWSAQVRQNVVDFVSDRALRLFLFPRLQPEQVIGVANLTQIVRGVAHCCTLGYGLSEREQGKGLMHEALRAVIDFAFGPLHLHRIQANYMPHNRRSGVLLRRLGFTVEGYARDYLLINGRWEDHILTSLTNPFWSADQASE